MLEAHGLRALEIPCDPRHGMRLDALWQALRDAPPGRILFLRSAVALDYRPEWWQAHSHITALTPVESGRGIVGGTFTHPAPVAGLVYSGSAESRPITVLAEQRDGLTLFGRPLESMTVSEFARWADELGISAVVVSEEDGPKLQFLESGSQFAPPRVIGPFKVYFARDARPLPEPVGPQTWRLVPSGGAGWHPVGFAYSPLWTATSEGRTLPTRSRDGMLEVEAPAGADITLRHTPGMAEQVGAWVTGLSGVTLAAAALLRRRGPS